MARKQKVLWSETPAGLAAYVMAKAEAQRKSWTVRMLPQKRHRFGFEARIECVSATDLAKCQPGHGPNAEGYESYGCVTR